MRFFDTDPRPGQPVSVKGFADGIRKMALALLRMELVNGRVDWKTDGGMRLSFNSSQPASRGVPDVYPWDIKTLTTTSVTVTRCWYMRGPITKISPDDLTASLTGTEIYVGAKIDTITGAITLEVNSDSSVIFDSTLPSDSQYVKIPLYKLTREAEGDGWKEANDYRGIPILPLYT